MMFRVLALAAASALFVTACSGGGGSAPATIPSTTTTQPSQSPQSLVSTSFVFAAPPATTSAATRTPKYITAHRDVLEAAIPRLLAHPTPPFAFQRQLEATYTLQTYDRLSQIKAPTLVVTGAEDVLIPAKNSEILAAQIPGAKLHLIPGVGHAFMDALDQFLEVFLPFAKSHPIAA